MKQAISTDLTKTNIAKTIKAREETLAQLESLSI